MQSVTTQTRLFPSWTAVPAAILAIVAAAIVVVYFSAQLGHKSATTSSAPVVTKSVGSQLVQHNASERNGGPDQPIDMGALRRYGPR